MEYYDEPLYQRMIEKNNYSDDIRSSIEECGFNILNQHTSTERPGMLLGKIQSGKTKTFIGIMSYLFDEGFDIGIVLTKGTTALATQTYERMLNEFEEMVFEDLIKVFDIINMPKELTAFELNQKLIIIVKKETANLNKLHELLFNKYNMLSKRNILIVDDEADFASIGFSKSKSEGINIKKIAGQIDDIRGKLKNCSFLQVTATPYSLYLQPEDLEIVDDNIIFKPIRPAFTTLVPSGEEYIGGEYYFEDSQDETSIASCLFEPVMPKELEVIKKDDRRRFKIEDSLESDKIRALRDAIVNFVVGGSIRKVQDRNENLRSARNIKFSFIVHTEQKKESHSWQSSIVNEILKQLTIECINDSDKFHEFIETSYRSFEKSIDLTNLYMPKFEEVINEVSSILKKEYVSVVTVNSENDVKSLLDANGQLKLRAPFTIFIGGQILDRGITIGNLIGFYYGRNPNTIQQDTVLQHSRMYGYRPMKDLAVTRFYTTDRLYSVMKNIHEFDTALRDRIKNANGDQSVVFIQKSSKNQIIPCSPNKLVLSNITTLKSRKRLIPVGFNTKKFKKDMQAPMKWLDDKISEIHLENKDYTLIDVDIVKSIIDKISETFEYENGYEWDVKAFNASMEYVSSNINQENFKNKVWLMVNENRNMSRFTQDGRFSNVPYTASGSGSEGEIIKEISEDLPVILISRQNGSVELGWLGHEFWWPVLFMPKNIDTVIFSSIEAIDDNVVGEGQL